MSDSREKRVTLRFYLDDPMYVEAFDQLMRRHRESSVPINTLIVEAIHKYLCQDTSDELSRNDWDYGSGAAASKHEQDNEELMALLRSTIRSEGDALLKKWSSSLRPLAIGDGGPAHGGDDAYGSSDFHDAQSDSLTHGSADAQDYMDEEEADDFASLGAAAAFCTNWG